MVRSPKSLAPREKRCPSAVTASRLSRYGRTPNSVRSPVTPYARTDTPPKTRRSRSAAVGSRVARSATNCSRSTTSPRATGSAVLKVIGAPQAPAAQPMAASKTPVVLTHGGAGLVRIAMLCSLSRRTCNRLLCAVSPCALSERQCWPNAWVAPTDAAAQPSFRCRAVCARRLGKP